MTFQKGNRANPNGRPKKGEATAEILRAIGDLEYKGSGKSYRERAALVLWEQAASGRAGSLQALQFIVERTEGKVKDVQDLNVTGAVELVPWGPKPDAQA